MKSDNSDVIITWKKHINRKNANKMPIISQSWHIPKIKGCDTELQ